MAQPSSRDVQSPGEPPLILLAPHRSGSSAVAQILNGLGLHLGQVLAPRRDNPHGFYESVPVHTENRRLLFAMDRDWTCPPQRIDLAAVARDRLHQAIADLSAGASGPWGFKDPRTVFTLGAWLMVLPVVQLVGVYRSSGAASLSLQRRDGFDAQTADRIAVTYVERLAALRRFLEFPIIGFEQSPEALADAVNTLAERIGLARDDGVVDLVDLSVVHHPAANLCAADEELADACSEPIPDRFRYLEEEVQLVLGSLSPPHDSKHRHLGPSYAARRAAAFALARSERPAVGVTLDLSPTLVKPADVPGFGSETLLWSPRPGQETLGPLLLDQRASHVVGAEVLDVVPPEELGALFKCLADNTDPAATVLLSGTVIDTDHPQRDYYDQRRDATFHADREPYLHHRSGVEAALFGSPWRLRDVQGEQPVMLTLDKTTDVEAQVARTMTGPALRRAYTEAQNQLREAQSQIEQVSAEIEQSRAAHERAISALTARADEDRAAHERVIAELRDEIERTKSAHQRVVADLTYQLSQSHDDLRQASVALAASAAEVASLQADLAATQSDLRSRRAAAARAVTKLKEHQAVAGALETERARLERRLAKAAEARDHYRSRTENLLAGIEEKQSAISRLRAQRDQADEMYVEANQLHADANQMYIELQSRRAVRAALKVSAMRRPFSRLRRGRRSGVEPAPEATPGAIGAIAEEPEAVARVHTPAEVSDDADAPRSQPTRPAAPSTARATVAAPATPTAADPGSGRVWPTWAFEELPDVTIAIPVFNAFEALRQCVESVVRNTRYPANLLLINDASTDERVAPYIDSLAGPAIRVLHNAEHLGRSRTANRGFDEIEHDVVLLDSEVEVVPGWLRRLVTAAAQHPAIATVSPLSSNADAFSAPALGVEYRDPAWIDRDGIGRLFARGADHTYPVTPVGSGYCLYMRRGVLDQIGGFDAEAFPGGYGEEIDFCMRATAAGWKHVVDDSTYVFYDQSAGFGQSKHDLMARGAAVLAQRYPDYGSLVADFVSSSSMRAARDRVAELTAKPGSALPRVLMVVDGTGGAEAARNDRDDALSQRFETLLLAADGGTITLSRREAGVDVPVYTWRLASVPTPTEFTRPDYRALIAHIMSRYGIDIVHLHHLTGHTLDAPQVARRLGIPVVASLHDYYYVCPTTHLLDGADQFCGGVCTPGQDECRLPTQWISANMPYVKHSGVYVWQDRVREMLEHVDAFAAPSESVAALYSKVFPEWADRIDVIEHGGAVDIPDDKLGTLPGPGKRIRILVAGSVDVHDGLHLIQALTEVDVEGRLEFHFIGDSASEAADLGVAHGPYDRRGYADLVRQIAPMVAGHFSITAPPSAQPLLDAWSVGLPVIATDLGAFHDRVTDVGGGWLVDPGDPNGTCDKLVSLAADPVEYDRVLAEIDSIGLRRPADAAADLESLYRRVLSAGSAVEPNVEVREPLRMGVVVRGDGERFPGSVHVRALRRYWHPSIADVVVPTLLDPNQFLRHPEVRRLDAILIERNALDPELTSSFIDEAKRLEIRLAVDLDDDLVDLPRSHPHYDSYSGAVGDSLRQLTTACDVLTVSTPALAERCGHLNADVVVLPNMLDERIWMSPISHQRLERNPSDPLRVLYFGNASHVRDLEIVRPAFEGNAAMRLSLVGITTPENAPDWTEVIPVPDRDYPTFVEWLRSIAVEFDVAIAPLEDSEWARCKSDLKFLEATALGLPVIASDVEPYRASVDHGKSGLLVDPSGWTGALQNLADDPRLCRRLAAAAARYVTVSRLMRHQADELRALLGHLAGR